MHSHHVSSGDQMMSSVHVRVGLPSRGTQTGWRNGPGPIRSLATTNTKSSTATAQAADSLAGEQLHWEGARDPGRQQAEHQPAGQPGHKGGRQLPRLGSQRPGQENEGNNCSPFPCITDF